MSYPGDGFMRAPQSTFVKAVHEAAHAVVALEMSFCLESVVLRQTHGDSGLPVDGLCSYCWLQQHWKNASRCAFGRAMTVFAGVLAESIVFGGDASVNFEGQTDD